MDDALESISVLKAWVVGVLVIGILENWNLAEGSNEHAGRKLVDHASGMLLILLGKKLTNIFCKNHWLMKYF